MESDNESNPSEENEVEQLYTKYVCAKLAKKIEKQQMAEMRDHVAEQELIMLLQLREVETRIHQNKLNTIVKEREENLREQFGKTKEKIEAVVNDVKSNIPLLHQFKNDLMGETSSVEIENLDVTSTTPEMLTSSLKAMNAHLEAVVKPGYVADVNKLRSESELFSSVVNELEQVRNDIGELLKEAVAKTVIGTSNTFIDKP